MSESLSPVFLPRLRANLEAVRTRMAQACRRAGRATDAVRLVAVTKSGEWPWVAALAEQLGVTDFGENRPQQLLARAEQLGGPVTWHMIGHLQTNKVKPLLKTVRWIHSVDRWKLLEALEQQARDLPVPLRVLLEVNVTGEASKDGFSLEELRSGWQRVLSSQSLEICGLMTMAELTDNPEDARPAFRALRLFRDELVSLSQGRLTLPELSMGMTGDFEVAIEEGATMVRVGSALFAGLQPE